MNNKKQKKTGIPLACRTQSAMDFNFNICPFILKQSWIVITTKVISDVGQNLTLVLCQFGYSLDKKQMVVLLSPSLLMDSK